MDNIQAILSQVDAERGALSALEVRISDLDLKLRSAMLERRTPEALSRWLSYAVISLQGSVGVAF